jgi:hypothetical protein
MFGREASKQLNAGQKVTIDKDDWQLLP